MQDIPDRPKEDLKNYTSEELAEKNVQNVQREIQANEEQMKASKPNLNAIEVLIMKYTILCVWIC